MPTQPRENSKLFVVVGIALCIGEVVVLESLDQRADPLGRVKAEIVESIENVICTDAHFFPLFS